MQKGLLICLSWLVGFTFFCFGQGVFISEYVEGSSYNKALEIYNGTAAAIDLAAENYQVEFYFNGSSSPGRTISLSGVVAPGDVYVLAHSSADAAITATADLLAGGSWYNGDDAVRLAKAGSAVDVIGQIGVDPGSQWGSGLTSTADNTLRRKSTICSGDSDGSDPFDPASEWDGFAVNDFTGLGSHSASCSVTLPAVVINEILADPASGLAGDANGDGVRSSSQDEFVELVNLDPAPVDVSGWELLDGIGVRHVFPAGTVINSGQFLVVFGGGTPTGFINPAQTASSGGLSLNNAGDVVTLQTSGGDVIDSHTYGSEGGHDQSLTRDPDGTGTTFVQHTLATGSGGALFSPGVSIDGRLNLFGAPDVTGPECTLVGVDPGPPLSVQFSLSDTESGISTIKVMVLSNAAVEIPEGSGNFYNTGDVVTFLPPETAPVLLRAAKINNSAGASIMLEVTDDAGNSVMCDPVYTTLSAAAPEGFALTQNYPNPFNPSTTIHFSVASSNNRASRVSIKIYDVSGREVKTLINEVMAPGEYSIEWDGANNSGQKVAGGMYIYRMVAGDFVAARKMLLLK